MAQADDICIDIPAGALVLLVGASGAGKSRFAARHFAPTQIVSSDRLRAMVSDDEADQSVSQQAFELLHLLVRHRLEARRLTVVDATNVARSSRAALLQIARRANAPAVAIVLDVSAEECRRNDEVRPHRRVGSQVITDQRSELGTAAGTLADEGFAAVYVLRGRDEIERARVVGPDRAGSA